jgi:type IX secretion system PorP/SprF family membrane protein
MYMRVIISFVFLVLCVSSIYGQDPQFSQFYATALYTNPAFAGSSKNIRVSSAVRSQYVALERNFRTAAVSIDGNINSLNGGLGFMATNDVAGDGFLRSTTYSGIYSYYIPVSRNISMRAALQGGVIQKTYDFTQFRFGDEIDDRLGFINPTNEPRGLEQIMIPNFSAGFLVYSNHFFGGLAVHNLAEPNQSFYRQNSSADEFKLPRRYTAHVGANIYVTKERNLDDRTYISPNVLFMQQRNFNQLNLGFLVKKQSLTLGAWFRQTGSNSDAVIGLIGLRLPKFRVGYSFDATVSGARTATLGTHEVTLVFEIKKHSKSNTKKRVKQLNCPSI